MQYFTFLGVGTLPEGYEEALYSFEDNKEEMLLSTFRALSLKNFNQIFLKYLYFVPRSHIV